MPLAGRLFAKLKFRPADIHAVAGLPAGWFVGRRARQLGVNTDGRRAQQFMTRDFSNDAHLFALDHHDLIFERG